MCGTALKILIYELFQSDGVHHEVDVLHQHVVSLFLFHHVCSVEEAQRNHAVGLRHTRYDNGLAIWIGILDKGEGLVTHGDVGQCFALSLHVFLLELVDGACLEVCAARGERRLLEAHSARIVDHTAVGLPALGNLNQIVVVLKFLQRVDGNFFLVDLLSLLDGGGVGALAGALSVATGGESQGGECCNCDA